MSHRLNERERGAYGSHLSVATPSAAALAAALSGSLAVEEDDAQREHYSSACRALAFADDDLNVSNGSHAKQRNKDLPLKSKRDKHTEVTTKNKPKSGLSSCRGSIKPNSKPELKPKAHVKSKAASGRIKDK